MRRPTRDEAGATAILFALVGTVLLGAGAVAADMGQVYAKRSALQSNVDMAVMAAVAKLDNAGACNAEVIAKAEEYLVKSTNVVADQVAVNLRDASTANGTIRCNNWRVDLTAPRVHVEFGLAKVFEDGADGVDIPAAASAQIKSPGQSSSLPMYAVAGCDIGQQTLSDPPPGPAPSSAPPTLLPLGTAQFRNLAVTPDDAPAGSHEPYAVTVTGQVKDGAGTTGQITFTNPDNGAPIAAGSATAMPSGSNWQNFTISATTVPQAVLDVPGIWWVRIRQVRTVLGVSTTNYSPASESKSFVVGQLLFCNGSVNGNFGTLKVARSDSVASDWLELNIIHGFQPRLVINPSSAVPCSPEDSTRTPESPSDCLGTDPGFPNEAATDGLVNGSGSSPGRLNHNTTPGCDRAGGSNRTMTAPALNDDVLTCYIVGTQSVGDVVAGSPGVLSADIFSSPRFFQIPVIPAEASTGSSGSYPIVSFRPGFITTEPLTSTRAARGSVTGHNGITFQSGHVVELRVTLFPEAALPETAPPVGGEIDYTGHGTKVLVLVQ